jgi:pyruvate,orthophosphate dikinase
MLGHRGVRLGLTYPEIYEMQIRAVLEAAAECLKEGIDVHPEIMVPRSAPPRSFGASRRWWMRCKRRSRRLWRAYPLQVRHDGRGRSRVHGRCRSRQVAEFFSFGTNDLTQATFSFSREDAENKFLPQYIEAGILPYNPFEMLDVEGVGRLMRLADRSGDAAHAPGLVVGICGEHGGTAGGDPLLPRRRARLRLVLGAARAHCAASRGSGGAQRALPGVRSWQAAMLSRHPRVR